MGARIGPLHVSLVAFPDAVISTLTGIYDVLNAFGMLAGVDHAIPRTPPFEIWIVGLERGPVPLASQLTVLDAISAAGGFTAFADDNDVRVIRRGSGDQEYEYRFNYPKYVSGRAPGTNIVLQPGDTIVVPE